jgi:hypothetical protein
MDMDLPNLALECIEKACAIREKLFSNTSEDFLWKHSLEVKKAILENDRGLVFIFSDASLMLSNFYNIMQTRLDWCSIIRSE